jgi:hypothetical protein
VAAGTEGDFCPQTHPAIAPVTAVDGERVLGEIVLKAQAAYTRDGTDKYLLDIYNVIGDPASRIK